ncbi:hypothetical protein [Thiohalocapsa marina]|nr:hypothetical protein [Thiohalocapsa marina]
MVAWLVGATAAQAAETWTLTAFDDDINAATVRIAAVRNAQAYGFKIYAPSHEDRIWATFLLPPDGPETFDQGLDLHWQVSGSEEWSLMAVTDGVASRIGADPAELRHAGPRYVSLVIGHARELHRADTPLRSLLAGETLTVRYSAKETGERQMRFSLEGADVAIAEVMALFVPAEEAHAPRP